MACRSFMTASSVQTGCLNYLKGRTLILLCGIRSSAFLLYDGDWIEWQSVSEAVTGKIVSSASHLKFYFVSGNVFWSDKLVPLCYWATDALKNARSFLRCMKTVKRRHGSRLISNALYGLGIMRAHVTWRRIRDCSFEFFLRGFLKFGDYMLLIIIGRFSDSRRYLKECF